MNGTRQAWWMRWRPPVSSHPSCRDPFAGSVRRPSFAGATPNASDKLAAAMQTALQNAELIELLDRASIPRRWSGPEASEATMRETFDIFSNYAYLLRQ